MCLDLPRHEPYPSHLWSKYPDAGLAQAIRVRTNVSSTTVVCCLARDGHACQTDAHLHHPRIQHSPACVASYFKTNLPREGSLGTVYSQFTWGTPFKQYKTKLPPYITTAVTVVVENKRCRNYNSVNRFHVRVYTHEPVCAYNKTWTCSRVNVGPHNVRVKVVQHFRPRPLA